MYSPTSATHRILCIVFDRYDPLDLWGPIGLILPRCQSYTCTLASDRLDPVVSSAGRDLTINPHLTLDHVLSSSLYFDTLLIPGGIGARASIDDGAFVEKVARLVDKARWGVFTVCTGSLVLAATGRLDGLDATTNKWALPEVAGRYPTVNWLSPARWVHRTAQNMSFPHRQTHFLTSSGVAAGMDAALHFLTLTLPTTATPATTTAQLGALYSTVAPATATTTAGGGAAAGGGGGGGTALRTASLVTGMSPNFSAPVPLPPQHLFHSPTTMTSGLTTASLSTTTSATTPPSAPFSSSASASASVGAAASAPSASALALGLALTPQGRSHGRGSSSTTASTSTNTTTNTSSSSGAASRSGSGSRTASAGAGGPAAMAAAVGGGSGNAGSPGMFVGQVPGTAASPYSPSPPELPPVSLHHQQFQQQQQGDQGLSLANAMVTSMTTTSTSTDLAGTGSASASALNALGSMSDMNISSSFPFQQTFPHAHPQSHPHAHPHASRGLAQSPSPTHQSTTIAPANALNPFQFPHSFRPFGTGNLSPSPINGPTAHGPSPLSYPYRPAVGHGAGASTGPAQTMAIPASARTGFESGVGVVMDMGLDTGHHTSPGPGPGVENAGVCANASMAGAFASPGVVDLTGTHVSYGTTAPPTTIVGTAPTTTTAAAALSPIMSHFSPQQPFVVVDPRQEARRIAIGAEYRWSEDPDDDPFGELWEETRLRERMDEEMVSWQRW